MADRPFKTSALGKPKRGARSRSVAAGKTRRALAKLKRVVAAADTGAEETQAPSLSAWEADFADSVEARLEAYGSAFTDPAKGDLDEPLSVLQAAKLREIERKTRPSRNARPQRAAKARSALSPARTSKRTSNKAEPRDRKSRRSMRGGSPSWVRDVDADLQEGDDASHDE